MRKLRMAIAAVIVALVGATPVLAATSVVVTVTGIPQVTNGIINFTITYVSTTRLDLSWGFVGDAVNIMIRGKYSEYPTDIPDQNTTPSDGYLLYYGSGVSVSDTSMNFDETTAKLYYKAWAQRADGTWHVTTSTGWKESETMALLALIALASVMSYFGIKQRNILIAIIASAVWIALVAYTRVNPIGNMTTGDTADSAILIALLAATFAVPIATWQYGRRGRERGEYFGSSDNYQEADVAESHNDDASYRYGVRGNAVRGESASDYQRRIHGILNPPRKRR